MENYPSDQSSDEGQENTTSIMLFTFWSKEFSMRPIMCRKGLILEPVTHSFDGSSSILFNDGFDLAIDL